MLLVPQYHFHNKPSNVMSYQKTRSLDTTSIVERGLSVLSHPKATMRYSQLSSATVLASWEHLIDSIESLCVCVFVFACVSWDPRRQRKQSRVDTNNQNASPTTHPRTTLHHHIPHMHPVRLRAALLPQQRPSMELPKFLACHQQQADLLHDPITRQQQPRR